MGYSGTFDDATMLDPRNITFTAGSNAPSVTNLLSNHSKLCFRCYSLHPSQYAKMSKKSVIPFDEMVAYKTPTAGLGARLIETTVISLGQVPDKLYIFIKKNVMIMPLLTYLII